MASQVSVCSAITAVMLICLVWIRFRPSPRIFEPIPRTSLREVLARNDSEADTSNQVTKESEYPPDWWTSTEILDIERRAIFSKVRSLLNTFTVAHDHTDAYSTGSYKRVPKGRFVPSIRSSFRIPNLLDPGERFGLAWIPQCMPASRLSRRVQKKVRLHSSAKLFLSRLELRSSR